MDEALASEVLSPCALRHPVKIVLDAGGHGQEMAHCDVAPRGGQSTKVVGDAVRETNPFLLDQEHDGCSRELLGVRGELVSGSRGGGCVQFYTGQPITSGFDYFAVAQNRKREAGHLLFLEMIRNVGINLICVKIDTSENQGDNDEGNRF